VRATNPLDLAKNEAVEVVRSQLLEVQRLASEPLIKETPHDGQVADHR
jgi:hypothetical protein